MKYKTMPFEFTWCDYLTPCPHKKDVMIGDYDCSECDYHIAVKQNNLICDASNSYSKYSKVANGVVFCAHS